MTTIEEIINKNRTSFDDELPDDGHFDRFQKKLEIETGTRRLKISNRLLTQAAAVVLLAGLAWFIGNYTHLNSNFNKKQTATLKDVSPEFAEVEHYYEMNLNQKIKEIENLQCTNFDNQKVVVLNEMKEWDKSLKSLQKDLSENTRNERVINAIIELYQTKIDVLNEILNKVKPNC